MRFAFYLCILPFVAACSLLPESWFTGTRHSFEAEEVARSYTILAPPPETILQGSETIYHRNYELNKRMVANVGEPILRVQAYRRTNFITRKMILEKPVEIQTTLEKITLPAREYPIYGMFEMGIESEPFFVLPPQGSLYVMINMDGTLHNRFLYKMRGSEKVTIFPDRAKITPKNARLKRVTNSSTDNIPFQDFEVIYDGIKNNQIVLFHKYAVPGTYGEAGSFNSTAYPADSTMISIEGTLVRIIRADKDKIEFIVLKNP